MCSVKPSRRNFPTTTGLREQSSPFHPYPKEKPMCEPTTIGLVIAAASAAAGVAVQEKNVSAQNKSNAQQRENAIEARNKNLSQLELAKQQATTQAGQKTFENNLAAQKAQATTTVAAGEHGVSGLSVDSLLSEIDGNRGRYNTSVEANLKDNVVGFDLQRENVQTGAVNSVSQLKTPAAPDYIGAGLKIGGAYMDYQKAQK
jgi:hypothetical protein